VQIRQPRDLRRFDAVRGEVGERNEVGHGGSLAHSLREVEVVRPAPSRKVSPEGVSLSGLDVPAGAAFQVHTGWETPVGFAPAHSAPP